MTHSTAGNGSCTSCQCTPLQIKNIIDKVLTDQTFANSHSKQQKLRHTLRNVKNWFDATAKPCRGENIWGQSSYFMERMKYYFGLQMAFVFAEVPVYLWRAPDRRHPARGN